METLPVIQDDGSTANPSSVKSDGSSPRQDGGRGSPPPNCAICLGTCRNKSFTDSCLHQFCFKCLLTWSKVKAECPLCKQNFKSIIHNVRSNHQYEEYMVEQRQTDGATERAEAENQRTVTRRFRYSTTLTLPRNESLAIQHLLMHYPLMAGVLPPPRRRRSPASFRRTVYRHNLWARPLPDFTGRFRDSTPDFYRYNDTQIHRLVPWLNRELSYLLNDNVGHISYVMTRIMELLPQYHITSPEFREAMRRYFGERTEHFLHELYCFASTPYDMTGYDRNVQYTTDSRISTMVNEVISSSESEASVDSDIVMVSSSGPAEPPAGPSGLPPPPPADNVIPIETISHSDTDDDSSEVMVVGYIKPPQERTPEVVDLLGSDSDVVVQEGRADPPPPPPHQHPHPTTRDPADNRTDSCVKLILKRQNPDRRSNSDESDDSDASYRPPAARRRRRPRSPTTTTTTTTTTATATATADVVAVAVATAHDPNAPAPRPPSTSSSSTTVCYTTESSESDYESSDDASYSDERRQRFARRKTKKRTAREAPVPRRERKRSDRRSSRNRRVERKGAPEERADRRAAPEERADRDSRERRNKRKSHGGKGVKSSKRREEAAAARSPERTVEWSAAEQPGTSGGTRRRRRDARDRRHSRRLKSVVNVMYGAGAGAGAGSSGASVSSAVSHVSHASHARSRSHSDSDSDDDLPLNLTVQKPHMVS